MLQFFLKRFGLHDLPSAVWRVTGLIVAALSIGLGALSLSAIFHHRIAMGDSTLLAALWASSIFPMLGIVWGMIAIMLLAFGRLIYRFVVAIPDILFGIGKAAVAIWNGIGSALRALASLPSKIAAMEGKDWALVAYMSVCFGIFAGIAIFMWPTAIHISAWLPSWAFGGQSFIDILWIDMMASLGIFTLALIFVVLILSLIVAVLKSRNKKD